MTMDKQPASKVQAASTKEDHASASTAPAKKVVKPKPKPKSKLQQNHRFDARPDRLDFRDLIYEPPLRSLPPVFPTASHRYSPLNGWTTEARSTS